MKAWLDVYDLKQDIVDLAKGGFRKAFPGFPFNWSAISVIRRGTGVNIIDEWNSRGSAEPYLRYEGLPKDPKKPNTFKRPAGSIKLAVRVNLDQWKDIENFNEDEEFRVCVLKLRFHC